MLSSSQRLLSTDLIKYELNEENKVGIITLNDPVHLNALTEKMGAALTRLLKRNIAKTRPHELKCIVLTGEGRTFSVGGDYNWLLNRHEDTPHNNTIICREFHQKFLNLRKMCPVPVISAINGAAAGTGFALACSTDIRIAHTTAKMGVNYVGMGLTPGMGSTHFLPNMVGPQKAAELLLTGALVTGKEAVDRGFILKACDDPLEESLIMADKISKQAPIGVRGAIRALRKQQDNFGAGLDMVLKKEVEKQAAAYKTEDLVEGIMALKEHRDPKFTGN